MCDFNLGKVALYFPELTPELHPHPDKATQFICGIPGTQEVFEIRPKDALV